MTDAIVFISKKDLIEIMKQAFDEGWSSFHDLRDSAVEKIVDDFLETRQKKSKIPAAVKLQPDSGGTLPYEGGSFQWAPISAGQHYIIGAGTASIADTAITGYGGTFAGVPPTFTQESDIESLRRMAEGETQEP